MQEQMGKIQEELRETKQQLGFVQQEKNRAFNQLRQVSEGLSPVKAKELFAELRNLKELLFNTQQEMKIKDKNIHNLKVELERAKQFQLNNLAVKEELSYAKVAEAQAMDLLSNFKKRVQELEAEVENRKLSESKLLDSLTSQTRQFEHTKIELEESKIQIASLIKRIESQESRQINGEIANPVFGHAKENLSKIKALNDEIHLLRNELKLANEAEEKSRKALDDLALALKEVATEASEAKGKLSATQLDLDQVKEEAGQLKEMIRNTEASYQKLLDEAKDETDLYRNAADKLTLEAEESLLAWNAKEMGFITCIKQAEEERALAKRETARLSESLIAAEHMTRAAREENNKLRDILKQAINEANAAKAASGLARDENSQLKDCLAEKEESLLFLARENEHLRISEAAAHENAKQFKQLLYSASTEYRTTGKEEQGGMKSLGAKFEEHEEHREVKRAFSFNLNELNRERDREYLEEKMEVKDGPGKAEALKGSIFDTTDSPKSEPRTPKPVSHHCRPSSSAFTDDEGTPNTEDLDHQDYNHIDDSDSDRNSSRRKRALFRRVGDLIMRKSFHKKEPFTE